MALLNLLRAPWKHSDPAKRAEAVRMLESDRRDVFLALATSDPDATVRLAAARRLTDEADLRKALERAEAGPARDLLREKLARIVAEWATDAKNVDALKAHAWLEELDALGAPEKIFAELSLRAPSPVVRRGTLSRLVHASSFLAVSVRETDDDIALEASFRLEKASHLESVARDAKNASARKSARERLRAVERSKGPDKAAQDRAKLGIILTAAEKAEAACVDLAGGLDWEAMRDQVEEAVRALEALQADGLHVSAAERAHFAANVTAFRERYAVHAEAEAARHARDAEEKRNRAIREEACERLEAIFADSAAIDADAIGDLENRFRETGTSDAGDPIVERFRIVRERIRDRLRKQREQEDAGSPKAREAQETQGREGRGEEHGQTDEAKAKLKEEIAAQEAKRREERESRAKEREEARRSAAAALDAVSSELESIVTTADFKGAEKRLRDLREKGNAAVAALGKSPDNAVSIGRFQAAAGRLRETLDWNSWAHLHHKQEMDQARAANLEKKRALCVRMENLGELHDDEARHASILQAQAEWKATGPVAREESDALWERFRKPIDAYFEARRERIAAAREETREMRERREEGISIREDIITEATSLGTLDRHEVAEKMRTLQAEWKAAPPVPRPVEQELWARFRKACDAAFGN